MIASVAGMVLALTPLSVVVEVGGVGLLVQCTPATLAGLRVGEPVRLATALVVRETELTLYGFADDAERDVYEILQGAAGVGPKLAQAVLGVLAPDEVRRAVADEDLAALTKVSGIGRKGAQRIVLDLKDKLGPPATAAGAGAAAGAGRILPVQRGAAEQVGAALAGLGYSAREAEDALAVVLAPDGPGGPDGPDGPGGSGGVEADGAHGDVGALLRAALAVLRPR